MGRVYGTPKTSPLDSFYSDYNESIRLKGNRYHTVFDFLVVTNVKLLLTYNNISFDPAKRYKGLSDFVKSCGLDLEEFKNFLDLKRRYGADKVFKIAKGLNVPMSELYVDRVEYTGEVPPFRFK